MPAKTAKPMPIEVDPGRQVKTADVVHTDAARDVVGATPIAPTFPTLDSMSNDNKTVGIGALTKSAVGFEGAASHYRLPLLATAAAIGAFCWFAYGQGVGNLLAKPEFPTWAIGVLVAIATLFVLAAMRRRTVGVWATGDEIRLSKGLPNVRLHQLKLKDVEDITVKTSRFGSSGSVAVRTFSGRRIVVRNVAHAQDASAYLPLMLAASRVRAVSASQRAVERQARVAATTPYVVALPRKQGQAS
ncbi:MAG: PH domain-containing protein [Pseudomonadota bacterium]